MPCQTPHLDETSSAAPDISPGLVEDDEPLLRIVLNPDHFRDGRIQSSAIPTKHLKESGFSVDRLRHVTQESVEASISKFLAGTFNSVPRESEGIACFQARDVRDVRDDGAQVFVVIDTALQSNRGHASIYLADLGMTKSKARQMREKLMLLLNNRVSVAEAFALYGQGP